MPKFAFQFIAGKYEGGTYVIPDDAELYLGRATDVEVVLIEDMVSRRHAQLTSHGGRLILRDLGSTNGTFVNGERIEACELELQDRVLVGTSMLRVVEAERVQRQAADANLKATLVGQLPPAQNLALAGELAVRPLRELLPGFAQARESGALQLILGDDQATLWLQDGALVHAELKSDAKVTPLNVVRHVLSWTEGDYRLTRAPAAPSAPATDSFAQGSAEVVAEALRHNDARQRLYEQNWRDAPQVSPRRPLQTPLRTLAPEALDALQLALEWHNIEAILEHAHHDDYALLLQLEELVRAGVLQHDAQG